MEDRHHQNQEYKQQDDNWEAFSLCSSDDSGLDEQLPIPGRESHTCDLDVFFKFLEDMKNTTRHAKDQKFNNQVWDFIQSILQKAKPIGYAGVDNPEAVSPKGPKDNQAFINKVLETSLINPIHPNLIADESGIPLDIIFTELLYATKSGMMSMKLSPNCFRSSNVICAMEKSQWTYFCDGCRYDNSIECLQKIKVVFTFNMDIFYVLAESFAFQPSSSMNMKGTATGPAPEPGLSEQAQGQGQGQAQGQAQGQGQVQVELPYPQEDDTKVFALVPATFSGSGFRYFIGCGGNDLMLSPALPKGLYRMKCPVARADSYLKVQNNAQDVDYPGSLSLHVSDIVRRPLSKRKTIEIPHGKFHLDVFTNTKSFYVCRIQDDSDDHSVLFLPEEERKPFTTAHSLLSHPTYRRLFAKGTEAMLRNVLNRMMMNPDPSEQYQPRSQSRRRPIRSLPA